MFLRVFHSIIQLEVRIFDEIYIRSNFNRTETRNKKLMKPNFVKQLQLRCSSYAFTLSILSQFKMGAL